MSFLTTYKSTKNPFFLLADPLIPNVLTFQECLLVCEVEEPHEHDWVDWRVLPPVEGPAALHQREGIADLALDHRLHHEGTGRTSKFILTVFTYAHFGMVA